MTKEQALKILKEPDRIGCNMIKANDEESCKYNQENIEALNIAIECINRLNKIEQIIKDYDNDSISEDHRYIDRIREILE